MWALEVLDLFIINMANNNNNKLNKLNLPRRQMHIVSICISKCSLFNVLSSFQLAKRAVKRVRTSGSERIYMENRVQLKGRQSFVAQFSPHSALCPDKPPVLLATIKSEKNSRTVLNP